MVRPWQVILWKDFHLFSQLSISLKFAPLLVVSVKHIKMNVVGLIVSAIKWTT